MQVIRYRTGIDSRTGQVLRAQAHLVQSIARIWLTRPDTLPMLLDFGSRLRSHLSEDITPTLVLQIYDDLVTAVHRHEPEYRIKELQLVRLAREGVLGLRHAGLYYPEGRLGNYAIVLDFGGLTPLAQRETAARRLAVRRAA